MTEEIPATSHEDDVKTLREALTWFGTVALSSTKPLIRELGEGILRDAGAALTRLTTHVAALDAEQEAFAERHASLPVLFGAWPLAGGTEP